METGLIHIYTGEGKGKTTAAIGLALRAASSGIRVLIVQFLKAKSKPSAELEGLSSCGDVTMRRYGGNLLGLKADSDESKRATLEIRDAVAEGLSRVMSDAQAHAFDLIVLDEINVAMALGLADIETVRQLINACKGRIELVLTGRGAPESILQRGDYITEFVKVRHPYDQGVQAREGIEY